jgi:hypothetical protein
VRCSADRGTDLSLKSRWPLPGSAVPVARVVGEAAVSAARTGTFLGERYRRIARRRGQKRAIVSVGCSSLVIVWALLSDEHEQSIDLGPDYYASRTNPERKVRQYVRELQTLGYSRKRFAQRFERWRRQPERSRHRRTPRLGDCFGESPFGRRRVVGGRA